MVAASQVLEEGELAVDRWVTRYKDDEANFVGMRAVGSGDFFVHVKGSLKRTSKDVADAKAVNAAAFMPGVPAEMAPLAKMAGTYAIKGFMIPAPGVWRNSLFDWAEP